MTKRNKQEKDVIDQILDQIDSQGMAAGSHNYYR